MTQDLPNLAARVVEILTPAAQAGPKRANLTSAIATAFRPYIEAAVTGAPPKPLRDDQDRREKEWLVSMAWYRGPAGKHDTLIASSQGRVMDTSGTVRAYGGDIVRGLDAAADLVADAATEIGAPFSDYGALPMRRYLGFLRATISKQGGYATGRRVSKDGCWYLVLDIFREDAFPNKEQSQ